MNYQWQVRKRSKEPTKYKKVWKELLPHMNKQRTVGYLKRNVNKNIEFYLHFYVKWGYLDRVGVGTYAKTPRSI